MESIILDSPLDMHLHLRDGEMLNSVARYTSMYFSAALVMPNITPPLFNVDSVLAYKERVLDATDGDTFEPYMSLFYSENLTKEELIKGKQNGIDIVKLYPKGATTNSEEGAKEILGDKTLEIFSWMESLDMILSIHGETNGFVLDREDEFLPIFTFLAKTFPKMRIIIEHLSSRKSIETIEKYDNLYGTVTLHHMLFTLDDVLGGGLNPHHFCKPIVKTPRDREAIRDAVFSGHKKISFGSDSAPHPTERKLALNGAAGIFSAPILLQNLTELFEQNSDFTKLQNFISNNAKDIYGIKAPKKEVRLIKKEMQVQSTYDGIIPMRSGEKIAWCIA